jgi:RNA polymerase sigma factor for flagellar operon FliA
MAEPDPIGDTHRLVRVLASRVLAGLPRGSGIEMSDLIQAGNIGLLQASRTFSSSGGASLAGYAKFRIRGEMLDTVRRHVGRSQSAPLMAAAMSTEDGNLENRIPAPAEQSPIGVLARTERARILRQEIERLPARYRAVVQLRYSSEFSLREIGAALQVNESRACQLHQNALGRLRRALKNRGVRSLWQLM